MPESTSLRLFPGCGPTSSHRGPFSYLVFNRNPTLFRPKPTCPLLRAIWFKGTGHRFSPLHSTHCRPLRISISLFPQSPKNLDINFFLFYPGPAQPKLCGATSKARSSSNAFQTVYVATSCCLFGIGLSFPSLFQRNGAGDGFLYASFFLMEFRLSLFPHPRFFFFSLLIFAPFLARAQFQFSPSSSPLPLTWTEVFLTKKERCDRILASDPPYRILLFVLSSRWSRHRYYPPVSF